MGVSVGLRSFLLVLMALLLTQDIAFANGGEGSLTGFLGRFHPVVLHFPIGLLMGLVVLEILVWPTGDARRAEAGRWVMLVIGTITAALASLFGLFLSWEATYDAHLLWEHKWGGIAVSVAAALALLARLAFNVSDSGRALWAYRLMVLASAGIMLPAGHHGGQLTHGADFLAKDIPPALAFLAPVLGHGESENEVVLADNYFATDILPILESKCFECHGAEKQKGDLRMDTLEANLAGGESGRPCIVPGNIAESYMIELMLLPADHEDVMPPEGKTPISATEIVTLANWISRGAPWGEYTPPEPVDDPTPEDIELSVDGAPGGVQPVVDVYEIMELFFEEPPERMSAALAEEPADRKARRGVLKVVFNEANALAEAHNLLFERTDEDYMTTPEWDALTVEGRDAAASVAEYLKDRDWEYAELRARYETLIESCNRCHVHFDMDVDTIEAFPAPEE